MQTAQRMELSFFEFIYDRQLLAVRKFRNLRPWTTDPILRAYKFCNVRRKDDACTIHLLNNVIYRNLTPADTLLNIILFRRFNVRYFWDQIIPRPLSVKNFNVKQVIEQMDIVRKNGVKLFNDAYISLIVGGPYNAKYRPHDKHVQLLLSLQGIIVHPNFHEILKNRIASSIFDLLHFGGRHSIGDFLAYQILIDLSYYRSILGMDSFVSVGPGARPGIDLIYGKGRHYYENLCGELCDRQRPLFKSVELKTGKDWSAIDGEPIALSDIQNCLCEFRKYTKIKRGLTQRKRRYTPA